MQNGPGAGQVWCSRVKPALQGRKQGCMQGLVNSGKQPRPPYLQQAPAAAACSSQLQLKPPSNSPLSSDRGNCTLASTCQQQWGLIDVPLWPRFSGQSVCLLVSNTSVTAISVPAASWTNSCINSLFIGWIMSVGFLSFRFTHIWLNLSC